MTSALPYSTKYRAQQAWRGGYGESVDEAEVILNESGLTFIFSVRNMQLESEIGVHWTMKCGNDIIEGAALIPPIALAPVAADPAYAEPSPPEPGDAMAAEVIPPDRFPAPVTSAPSSDPFAAGAPSGNLTSFAPALGAGLVPFAVNFSDSEGGPGSSGGGSVVPVPVGVISPTVYTGPTTTVPEPSAGVLLASGLFFLLSRKRIIRLINLIN